MIMNSATIKTRELLTRSLWITASIVGLIVVVLGLRVAIDSREATSLNAESIRLEKQVQQGAPPADDSAAAEMPHGLAVLGVLQNAVTQAASKNSCQLIEFKAGTTIAPYTPRYRKDVPEGAWSQMDAHFILGGKLRDVVETLRHLNELNLPIEIDAVSLVRDSFLQGGSAHINAQVQLRAISQGAAS